VRVISFYNLCFIVLLFGRIDSVLFTTVEIGVCECKPQIPLGIVLVQLILAILTMFAHTSQNIETESASPNPSP